MEICTIFFQDRRSKRNSFVHVGAKGRFLRGRPHRVVLYTQTDAFSVSVPTAAISPFRVRGVQTWVLNSFFSCCDDKWDGQCKFVSWNSLKEQNESQRIRVFYMRLLHAIRWGFQQLHFTRAEYTFVQPVKFGSETPYTMLNNPFSCWKRHGGSMRRFSSSFETVPRVAISLIEFRTTEGPDL